MTPHVLQILRGFEDDGPGRLALGVVKNLDPAEARVSVVALAADGPLRAAFEREAARHGGTTAALPTGWLGVRAAGRRIAELARAQGATHLHAHLLRADAVGRVARDQLPGLPYFVTEHALHGWGERGPLLRPLVRRWYVRSLDERSTIVAISRWEARALEAEGVPGARIRTVLNGVDLGMSRIAPEAERSAARRALGIPDGAGPVLLTLGVLTRRKSPETTLRAVAALRSAGMPAWALLAGTGPRAEELRAVADSLGLREGATLAGYLPDPAQAVAAADVLMHPAVEEPYGLVVAEALASGLPVVARAGTGASELLPPAPDSETVAGEAPGDWAAASRRLADAVAADRAGIGARCRAHAEATADLRRCAGEYLALYSEAASASRA
ncbi:MAG: glycosyltransferase family 4 protein [Candidatus Sumerlaeia bacterium]|nr:glycosyltransferase family 4 protein [Candidatus Sumerlaeia bacterium]